MFNNDQEELAFYREFFESINATAYVMSFDPFKFDWLFTNDNSTRLTGRTEEQLVNAEGNAPFLLYPEPDFVESIVDQIAKYEEDPDTKWGGVFRVVHSEGREQAIVYTSAALKKDDAGKTKSIACIAISLDDIFNTPKTLWELRNYIAKKINIEKINLLTDRQKEVMKLIGQGFSRKIIAQELKLSEYTIEDHKKSLFKKFNCNSVKVLAQVARELALV